MKAVRRWPGIWLLAVALLVVQTLGGMHRIAHVGPTDALAALAAEHAAASGGLHAPAPHGAFEALFAGHAEERDCDAFEQMSLADAVVTAPLFLSSQPLPAAPVIPGHAWHIAAQACGFLARGPPVVT